MGWSGDNAYPQMDQSVSIILVTEQNSQAKYKAYNTHGQQINVGL